MFSIFRKKPVTPKTLLTPKTLSEFDDAPIVTEDVCHITSTEGKDLFPGEMRRKYIADLSGKRRFEVEFSNDMFRAGGSDRRPSYAHIFDVNNGSITFNVETPLKDIFNMEIEAVIQNLYAEMVELDKKWAVSAAEFIDTKGVKWRKVVE